MKANLKALCEEAMTFPESYTTPVMPGFWDGVWHCLKGVEDEVSTQDFDNLCDGVLCFTGKQVEVLRARRKRFVASKLWGIMTPEETEERKLEERLSNIHKSIKDKLTPEEYLAVSFVRRLSTDSDEDDDKPKVKSNQRDHCDDPQNCRFCLTGEEDDEEEEYKEPKKKKKEPR